MPFQSRIRQVGVFSPNTREARAALLLHELGHMIPNPNGGWLLRDDGDDYGLSAENTRQVIKVCREQISTLHKISIGEQLLAAHSQVARASTLDQGTGR